MRKSRVGVFFLILTAAGSLGRGQPFTQPQETLPGFAPGNLLEVRGIDNVNVYSGDPGVVIPLSPEYTLAAGSAWQFRAYHSAKSWTLDNTCTDTGGVTRHRAYVTGYPTLGAGWTAELGYVKPVRTDLGIHRYTSPDGAPHEVGGLVAGPFYSDFHTNLRVRRIPTTGSTINSYEVDFPDGTIHVFDHRYNRPWKGVSYDFSDVRWQDRSSEPDRYGLSKIKNRFNQVLLDVEYVADLPLANAWKVRRIRLNPPASPPAGACGQPGSREICYNWGTTVVGGLTWDVLLSVDFPNLGGGKLAAAFAYQPHSGLTRNGFHDISAGPGCAAIPSTAAVPILGSITLSGTGLASLSYGLEHNLPPSGSFQGTLRQITLPTGGQIAYTYDGTAGLTYCTQFDCPDLELTAPTAGAVASSSFVLTPGLLAMTRFVDNSPAVVSRKAIDPVTGLTSTSTYDRIHEIRLLGGGGGADEARVTRRVIVTDPGGNGTLDRATKHLFHVGVDSNIDRFSGVELVRRHYETQDADDTGGGVTVRSMVFCYGESGAPGGRKCGWRDESGAVQNYRQGVSSPGTVLQAENTWYGAKPQGGGVCPNGPIACSAVERSNFNSTAGKFRLETRRDSLGFTTRTTETNWIPQTGSWLLDLYDRRIETEGTSRLEQRFDFNLANGFLRGTLTYDDPDATANDQMLVSCRYDFSPAKGLAEKEFSTTKTWTASQTIPQDFCVQWYGSIPTTIVGINHDAFGHQHSYATNSLRTSSQWLRSTGTANQSIGWSSFDVTRDTTTGWVTSSRDSAAVSTSYGYDLLGRLTAITPTGEASTSVIYNSPTETTVSRAGGAGNDTLEKYLYDSFGRLIREIRQMPSGYAVRKHQFDEAGTEFFVSEWGSCTNLTTDCVSASPPGTTLSDFDPFGRPQNQIRADGSSTTISHADIDRGITYSATQKSVTVNNVNGRCTGLSCSQGSGAKTDYRYDLQGRLVRVTEPGPAETYYSYDVNDKLTSVSQSPQLRSFRYNAFGFLVLETTPEKGTVTYGQYGSLGNLRRRTEADGTVISPLYDAAGRETCLIQGTLPDSNTLTCATATGVRYVEGFYDEAGFGSSLGKLTRRIGHNPGTTSAVTEAFTYSGTGGRLSQKTVSVSGAPQAVTATETWTYNTLGQVSTHGLPRVGGSPDIVASYQYTRGLPTSLSAAGQPLVSASSYHPFGGLASWTAGSNVVTTISQDISNRLPRPSRIFTSLAGFDTGTYVYDGAGNVKETGSDLFSYDLLSRLSTSNVSGQARSYFYDRFGNRTGTADANNRLIGGQYDLRGNLLSFGGPTYNYDALSRQVALNGGQEQYLYSGSGERLVILRKASDFYTITPCRLFDSRQPSNPLTATPRLVQAAGACGVPSGASAVSGNLTVTAPSGQGALTLTPAGSPGPETLPYRAGQTRANNFVLGLPGSGQLSIFSSVSADGIIDLNGYFQLAALSSWTLTLRDEANRLSSEYTVSSTAATRVKNYFYFGNLLVATRDGAGDFLYYHSDHLGTPRLVTRQAAPQVMEVHKYQPFGEEISGGFGTQPLKFAAMERSGLAANDYVHARYSSSSQGRFLSPDQVGGKSEDPQTWNRYSYARTNPMKYVDRDGKEFGYPGQQRDLDRVLAAQAAARGDVYFGPSGVVGDPGPDMVPPAIPLETLAGFGLAGAARGFATRAVGTGLLEGQELISGKIFTREALERIADPARKASFEKIFETLKTGERFLDKTTGNLRVVTGAGSKQGFTVVTDASANRVISVIPTGKLPATGRFVQLAKVVCEGTTGGPCPK